MKIASKISFSFVIVGLILTSIAGTIFYRIAKNSLQHSIYNNLSATVASRSNHIETYLKMLETSVVQLSSSAAFEDLLEIINIAGKESIGYGKFYEEAMTRLRRIKEANPVIYEFLLLDATGKVIASSNESSIGSDKSMDAIFLGGEQKACIKDVYYSEDYKEPMIAVSVPFLNSDTGEFLGVFAARVGLNELNSIVVEKTGVGDTGEIYLVNKQGFMITPSRFKEDVVLKQKVDSENVRGVRLHEGREYELPEKKKIAVFPDYRGVQVLGTHGYIPRMQWGVLGEIDAKEALVLLVELRLVFSMILIIAPIIVWLLGVLISGFIVGPLQMPQKGAEIIGKGNLDYKMSINTRDEVGQLSRAFDAMIENLKNSVVSIKVLNKEITERKQVKSQREATFGALRESEVRNKALFVSAAEGIAAADLETKQFRYVNPAMCRMFGYTEEELIRLGVADIHPKESLSHVQAEFGAQVRGEKTLADELPCLRKDGTLFYANVSASPIVLNGRKCFVGFFTDVTQRKQAEEELRAVHNKLQQTQQELIQASKMAAMGQLAAGISHELNQPLTGIKGFSQAVLADLEKESPFRSDLNKIVEQADRIDAIIKNVRFFARKSDFNMVETDINQVISESLMLLNQQLKMQNIRVIMELGLGIPKIQGNLNQLQQAFINIINNSRDAILSLARPESGEIRVRTALVQDKKHIQITFQDTGGGIPGENLGNMSTPFFTTKSPDKGLGLGLSITYRIIENHQGKVDFQTKVGEGTTFRIVLPLRGGGYNKGK